MKLLKSLALSAVILSSIILGSCSIVPVNNDDVGTDIEKEIVRENKINEESHDDAVEKAGFGKSGWAVDTEDGAYYWKFSDEDLAEGEIFASFGQTENTNVELVRFENGNETVVANTTTAAEFAVTHDKIFFTDNSKIAYFELDSEQKTTLDITGEICGITEDGEYLVYTYTNDEYKKTLYTLCTLDMSVTKIRDNCDFVAVHNGKIYYSPTIEDYESASCGEMKLCSSNPDASDFRMIYHSFSDLYDYSTGSACSIAQIRFTDEYIYFSYGSIAGTGHFYQGGNIIKVRYDGSGATTLHAYSDETFIDSEFTVNPDGSVTAIDVMENNGLYNFQDKYITRDGRIYWFDDITGEPTSICSYYPDENYDLSTVDFVNVTEKHAYFITHYCTYNPEKNFGWRDYYEREKSIFYMIDRKTEEIVTVYEF